jgi:hypothetical protein
MLEPAYIRAALPVPVWIRAAVPVGPRVGMRELVAPLGSVELLGVLPEPVWPRAEPQERVAVAVVLQVQFVRQGALEAVQHYPGAYWEGFHEQVAVALRGLRAVSPALAHQDARWELARVVPLAVPLVLVRQDAPSVPVAQVVSQSLGPVRGGYLEAPRDPLPLAVAFPCPAALALAVQAGRPVLVAPV